MTYEFHGFGLAIWGKRNLEYINSTCSHCQTFTRLESYDGSRYLIALFVPLIPLGFARVKDHCPICHHHEIQSLKDLKNKYAQHLSPALQLFREDPRNLNNAFYLLNLILDFQDKKTFQELAPTLQSLFAGDASFCYGLGHAFLYFSEIKTAIALLKSSLQLQETEAAKEELALALLIDQRPDEADLYLNHILEQKKFESIWLLMWQIEAFQALGRHQRATEIIEACLDRYPGLYHVKPFRKTFRRYVRIAKQNMGSSKIVPSPTLKYFARPQKRAVKNNSFISLLLRPTIAWLLIIISLYQIGAVQKSNREIYVVNGLKFPYTIEIDGQQQYTLKGLAHDTIYVTEGEHTVTVVSPVLPISKQTFWATVAHDRIVYDSGILVLNPDCLAVIMKQKKEYPTIENDFQPRQWPPNLFTGRYFYKFADIDSSFSDFPEEHEVSMLSKGEEACRIRLSLLKTSNPTQARPLLKKRLTPEERAAFIQTFNKFYPNDPAYQNL